MEEELLHESERRIWGVWTDWAKRVNDELRGSSVCDGARLVRGVGRLWPHFNATNWGAAFDVVLAVAVGHDLIQGGAPRAQTFAARDRGRWDSSLAASWFARETQTPPENWTVRADRRSLFGAKTVRESRSGWWFSAGSTRVSGESYATRTILPAAVLIDGSVEPDLNRIALAAMADDCDLPPLEAPPSEHAPTEMSAEEFAALA